MTPRDSLRFEIHPLADLLPRMGGAEFDSLKDDIAAHGQQSPIVMFDGKILDGRHRYEACLDLGIDCASIEFEGGDPVAFVLSANVHRRHLPAGQVGAIVTLARQWGEANPINGLDGEVKVDASDRQDCRSAQVIDSKGAAKQAAVAKAAGISERTLRDSEKVGKADKALLQQVAAGAVSLPKAVEKVTGKRPGTKETGNLAGRIAELEARVAELTAERDQLADDNRELLAEAEAMGKIIDADDKLKAAAGEIKKLQGQVAKLEQRIAGLQNEKNAAIRAAKSAQRKK